MRALVLLSVAVVVLALVPDAVVGLPLIAIAGALVLAGRCAR